MKLPSRPLISRIFNEVSSGQAFFLFEKKENIMHQLIIHKVLQ